MKTLLIYGSGGLGREMADLADIINRNGGGVERVCFIDDFTDKRLIYGREVVDFDGALELHKHGDVECVIALGEPALRRELFDKCRLAGFTMGRLIAPSAVVSGSACVGEGVIVSHNAFVSADCVIGDNVLLQPTCNMGHDSVVGENSVISPHVTIAGNCVIGSCTYVGMGAAVRERVRIGSESIVSMGAVVTGDVPDGVIAVGNPARVVKLNEGKRVFKG
jgi:sugar O-acyltransferase (sialic acid O-acetyltransferase NeuD family)